jgi:hypothetical protein
MYIGIRRIGITQLSKKLDHRIDRGSKHVILEMVFHSTPAKTAIVIFLSCRTNLDSVNTRELGCKGKFGKAIVRVPATTVIVPTDRDCLFCERANAGGGEFHTRGATQVRYRNGLNRFQVRSYN